MFQACPQSFNLTLIQGIDARIDRMIMGLFGKKYKCDTCGASFKSQNELMEHGKIHMQSSQTGSFKCQACGMSFQSQADLRQHTQRTHGM